MFSQEAIEQYKHAQKLGQKFYKSAIAHGEYPYLQVLDEILNESMIAGRTDLGLVEIPTDLIVGTRAAGRRAAFAGNFMPLLPYDTEFGRKWITLCDAHLGDEGIRDAIKCYEYLGRFYVEEGNKRVSVLKSYDAPTVPGRVTRLIPVWSDDTAVQVYYEFLKFYELSRVYQVHFSRLGSYAKLQAALGFDADHVWTENERASFLSSYYRFRSIYVEKSHAEQLNLSTGGALLTWLQVYSFDEIRTMSPQELERSLSSIWQDVRFMAENRPSTLLTVPEEPEKGVLGKLLAGLRTTHLDIAFVHGVSPTISSWVRGHDLGREYLEQELGDRVSTRTYIAGRNADAIMEQAIAEGAQLIIATAPTLMSACRKASVLHPNVKFLNCALSLPVAGVRTYYSRIYEAKFITGAIAGAVTSDLRVGYVGRYPILGAPAAINAFALGLRMTNPDARVILKWSCLPGNPTADLIASGIRVISNRETASQDQSSIGTQAGTYRLGEDGIAVPLASPCWNWGKLYEKIVLSILDGSWQAQNDRPQIAVSYWWGMNSGVIDLQLSDTLPAGIYQLARILQHDLMNGVLDPFHCPITDQNGIVRNSGEARFTPDDIMCMDWLCDNVEGYIPHYDELLPMSQGVTRLLGVFRDEIPPEKEAILL